MKQTIEELLKEAQVKTSAGFTKQTMERLERRLHHRMQAKIYCLIAGIVLFFSSLIVVLISKGFVVVAFGLLLNLPKVPVLIGLTMTGVFITLYLYRTAKNLYTW